MCKCSSGICTYNIDWSSIYLYLVLSLVGRASSQGVLGKRSTVAAAVVAAVQSPYHIDLPMSQTNANTTFINLF